MRMRNNGHAHYPTIYIVPRGASGAQQCQPKTRAFWICRDSVYAAAAERGIAFLNTSIRGRYRMRLAESYSSGSAHEFFVIAKDKQEGTG